jgi:biopolymer transport protein ExbD
MLVKPFVSKRPRIEMVPLIDMFFLLLVFFIFGVFSMTMQEGIVVALPAAKTGTLTEEAGLTISVTAGGALFLNQEPMTHETLTTALLEEARRSSDRLVVINADRQAAHGTVMSVLDAVRQAGLRSVSLQTTSEAR